MRIEPFNHEELEFAWSYRVYYRWRTHRARPQAALSKLDQPTLDSMLRPYSIHVLEASANETDVKMLASLLPDETVAACAGKAKGRVSKWLRGELDIRDSQKLLSRGYFACTTGKSTAEAVDDYLEQQSAHHGYDSRICPPVFVHSYPITPADEQRLSAQRAATVLRLHVVLSTWRRTGVFGQTEGQATAERWRQIQGALRIAFEKVSFVPDHVHLGVRIHPSVSPAMMVVELMNVAQELLWRDFADSVVRAGVERLWQPSGYIGAYGDLESAKIASYVRRWENGAE